MHGSNANREDGQICDVFVYVFMSVQVYPAQSKIVFCFQIWIFGSSGDLDVMLLLFQLCINLIIAFSCDFH